MKKDDLVNQRDLATNVSTNVNAGRTEHQGIEAGVGVALGARSFPCASQLLDFPELLGFRSRSQRPGQTVCR
jgi:hypothetical protein